MIWSTSRSRCSPAGGLCVQGEIPNLIAVISFPGSALRPGAARPRQAGATCGASSFPGAGAVAPGQGGHRPDGSTIRAPWAAHQSYNSFGHTPRLDRQGLDLLPRQDPPDRRLLELPAEDTSTWSGHPVLPLQDVTLFRVSSHGFTPSRPKPVQSGDVVRTRMDSGASPHHRNAPDFCAEKEEVEASGACVSGRRGRGEPGPARGVRAPLTVCNNGSLETEDPS